MTKTKTNKIKYFYLVIFLGIVMVGTLFFFVWNNSRKPLKMDMKSEIKLWLSEYKSIDLAQEEINKEGGISIDLAYVYTDPQTGDFVSIDGKRKEFISKGEQAVPILIAIYNDDNDLVDRYRIIDIIGDIGGRKATEFLASVLEESKEYDIKSRAAERLAFLGDDRVVPYLLEMFPNADNYFQKKSIFLLKNFNNNNEVIDFLISIIQSKSQNSTNKIYAAKVLGGIDDEKLTPAAEKLLQNEKEKRDEVIDFLISVIQSRGKTTVNKIDAAEALNNIDNEQAVPTMEKFLKAYAKESPH